MAEHSFYPGQRTLLQLLRWNRSVSQVEVVHASGRISSLAGVGHHWHHHPEAELTCFRLGRGTRLIADHVAAFAPGDLVLIGPEVPHYWHTAGSSAGVALMWDCTADHGLWNLAEAASLRRLLEVARRGLQVRGATAVATRTRMEALEHRLGLDRLAGFLEILAGLVAAPARDLVPLSARAYALTGNVESREAIRRAVSYIMANYRDGVGRRELLRLTGMSRATFARQFQLHVGKPFSAIRNEVRLQAVCQALLNSEVPVGTIALDHGFNQLSFFNRLFRREFGLSPSEYRRRQLRVVSDRGRADQR